MKQRVFKPAIAATVLAGALTSSVALSGSASAADIDSAPEQSVYAAEPASGWRFNSPFSPCHMNCSATIYIGRYVDTSMTSIFLKYKVPPWNWKFRDSTLVSGSFSREVLSYEDIFAFETEIGVGKRFGELQAAELWGALYFRWKDFPWNDYLRTTIALSTGVNWASKIDRIERTESDRHSQLLHYLAPEITFGLPSQPNWDVVFRFHHRSGGEIGLFNKATGGAQYQTVGVRYTW